MIYSWKQYNYFIVNIYLYDLTLVFHLQYLICLLIVNWKQQLSIEALDRSIYFTFKIKLLMIHWADEALFLIDLFLLLVF
jgi:hypothetical protein